MEALFADKVADIEGAIRDEAVCGTVLEVVDGVGDLQVGGVPAVSSARNVFRLFGFELFVGRLCCNRGCCSAVLVREDDSMQCEPFFKACQDFYECWRVIDRFLHGVQ